MPAFMPLPSGNPAPNPLGFAEAASGAYGNALYLAQRLRAAAAQQQQLQQARAQKQFSDELELRKAGYVPFLQTTGQDPSGLKRRDTAPGTDPSTLITDPYGHKWVKAAPMLTPAQQQTAAHENSDDLMRALEHGGQPVSPQGTVFQNGDIPRYSMPATGPANESNLVATGGAGVNVPPPHPELVHPIGSQKIYMPSEGEKLQSRLRAEAKQAEIRNGEKDSTPSIDTEHFSTPVSINHRTGEVRPLKLPAGVTHKDKPDKPEKYTYGRETDDNGRVTVTRIGEDGAEKWNGKSWVPMGAGEQIGPRRKDPDAPAKPTAAQIRGIVSKKATGLKRAEEEYARSIQFVQRELAKLKPVAKGNTAGEQQRKDILDNLNAQKQTALDTLNKAKQATQDEFEESLDSLGYPSEHFDYSGQRRPPAPAQPPAAAAAPAPAQPAGPPTSSGRPLSAPPASTSATPGPGPAKIASVDHIRTYAKQKKIPLDQALQEFRQSGYTIGR